MRLAGLMLLAGAPLIANKLDVYSELTRVDPFGQIVPQDRGSAPPRTILSPGIPRNATSSLRIAVSLDKPGTYHLDIAQNPENSVKPMLYMEVFEKVGDTWVPDRLKPVTIPYQGTAADFSIPGQTVVTFWLDMTVPRDAPVDRIKIEPQLWVSAIQDWVIYPMEVRIMEPLAPDAKIGWGPLPPVAEPADAAVRGPLRTALCGTAEESAPAVLTARAYVRRNAIQHLSIAGGSGTIKTALAKIKPAPVVEAVCGTAPLKVAPGPEWFLRLRDMIFRLQSKEIP